MGGVLADVDVTEVYDYAQSTGRSFYMTTLYNTLKIADDIENFRYRIENGEVYLYDNTSIGPTYLRKRNKTLVFVWFNNNSDIDSFIKEARKTGKSGRKCRTVSTLGAMTCMEILSAFPVSLG